MKKRVLLGMSGGVDSSVSAILLKESGYEVVGITMKLYSFSSTYDAKRVCDMLDIPHYTIDYREEFKRHVIDDFIDCYKNAMTPNPCIECNKYLKFGFMYKKALELDCEYIATGHYAKVEYSDRYNSYVLKKSSSEKKDQTYFLYNIPKEILPKILFPLENYTDKNQIREIAKQYGLKIANKPDSQEVCFIPDNNYTRFLLKNMEKLPDKGEIVTSKGEILGSHKGLIYYTVGQRKGLGISYKEPLYVVGLDMKKNQVIVGTEKELYSKELYARDINLLINEEIKESTLVKAKIRYRASEEEAIIHPITNNKMKVEFKKQVRAITPGQSVVFYQDGVVIGGGKIVI